MYFHVNYQIGDKDRLRLDWIRSEPEDFARDILTSWRLLMNPIKLEVDLLLLLCGRPMQRKMT